MEENVKGGKKRYINMYTRLNARLMDAEGVRKINMEAK